MINTSKKCVRFSRRDFIPSNFYIYSLYSETSAYERVVYTGCPAV